MDLQAIGQDTGLGIVGGAVVASANGSETRLHIYSVDLLTSVPRQITISC